MSLTGIPAQLSGDVATALQAPPPTKPGKATVATSWESAHTDIFFASKKEKQQSSPKTLEFDYAWCQISTAGKMTS